VVAQGEEEVFGEDGSEEEDVASGSPLIYETHAEAFQALENELMQYRTVNPPPGRCLLAKTTPGIGKTRVGLHLARMKAVDDQRGMWATSTRNMAWQAHDRFKSDEWGAQVLMLEGRHSGYTRLKIERDGTKTERQILPNCFQYEKVVRARQRGFPIRTYVCNGCPHCPTFKDSRGERPPKILWCRYFRNYYEACNIASGGQATSTGAQYYLGQEDESIRGTLQSKIIVATHHMMAAMIADGEMLNPDWVIVDEDPIAALRETYSWDEIELHRNVDSDVYTIFRALLGRTIDIAKERLNESPVGWQHNGDRSETRKTIRLAVHRATDYGHTTLWGIDLARIMWVASRQLDINLKQILNDVSCAPPLVAPGEMFRMSQTKFDQLPHFKERDLASELLHVVETAEQQDQKAYKVSLRREPEKPWAFVWDHVRRISYEGPLFFLDAYGSPEIIKRYTNREVDTIDVRCKVRSNVTVRWYPNIGTNRAQLDEISERNSLFDDALLPELQRHFGEKVLIYTQKRYAEWLDESIKRELDSLKFSALTIKWFWMDRGDDSFAGYDTVIIFGTPIPNVIAERQFANALYAGEEPLSWARDSEGRYLDIRSREHCEARQENEMRQCIFRLRIALPNDKSQEVVVFSRMKLPLEIDLNGAEHQSQSKSRWNIRQFAQPMMDCFEQLGCWTDAFSAFVGVHEKFIAWAKGETTEFPFNYVQMQRRHRRILKTHEYRKARFLVIEKTYDQKVKEVGWKGQVVHYFGDEKSVVEILDKLRQATRDPGCDEEETNFGGRGPGSDDIFTRDIPADAWQRWLEIEREVDTIRGQLLFSGRWHFGDWMPPREQQRVDELYLESPLPPWIHYKLIINKFFEARGFRDLPVEDRSWRDFMRAHQDVLSEIMERTKGMTEAPDLDEFDREPSVTANVVSIVLRTHPPEGSGGDASETMSVEDSEGEGVGSSVCPDTS
jgi:hypothetical protein